jgi:hypothetical protein
VWAQVGIFFRGTATAIALRDLCRGGTERGGAPRVNYGATTLASVREESGRVIARSVLPTDAAALTEFFRGVCGAILRTQPLVPASFAI